MQRPWFRRQTWAWYVEIDGRQHPLGKHPGPEPPRKGKRGWSPPDEILAAWRAKAEELAGPGGAETPTRARQDMPFGELAHRYLAGAKGHIREETRGWYLGYLQDFLDRHPGITVAGITPELVREWLAAERSPMWGVSSIRGAICAMKRALNWGVERKWIASNPIAKVRKPKARRRRRVLTADERAAILAMYPEGDCFRDYLVAAAETGCRPGEIMRVRACDVDLDAGVWRLQGKDFHATGEMRTIYLTPALVEISRRLADAHPSGPIFRNQNGKPWTRKAINNRFVRKKARKDQPLDRSIVAYSYRHTFATEAIARGLPVQGVSALIGHRSLSMLANYDHTEDDPDYMRRLALRAVTGEAAPTTSPGRTSGAAGSS